MSLGANHGTLAAQRVAVCACTFRRPDGLRALLSGLALQSFENVPRPALHIVIADNEGSECARNMCAAFEQQTGLPVSYVYAPERGISFARNACLDHIPDACAFFAFIDDDEIPAPDWLEKLIEAQAKTGADVVQGSVVAIFAEGAPRWLKEGGFLGWPRRNWRGTRPDLTEFDDLPEAYTNNVLVRRESVTRIGVRFDPAYALTGGGDTAFFRELRAAGNRIVYAPRAVVTETVPPDRATLWYRLKLEYRIALSPLSAKTVKKDRTAIRTLRHVWRDNGPAKMVSGVAYLATSFLGGHWTMDRVAVAGMRMAYGAGQLARTFRLKYHIYR